MKKIKKYIMTFTCVLCSALSMTGCDKPHTTNPEHTSGSSQSSFSVGTNYDAIETIMDDIYEEEENNIMYSPLSLNFALGMTSNGATDEVKSDFEKYFNSNIETYNDYYYNLIKKDDKTLKIANSVWVRDNYTINKNFEKTVKKYYDAKCDTLPFDDSFVKTLNKWCKNKTNGLIPEILQEPPSDDAKMVLANALYFKGEWEEEYKKESVKDIKFETQSGDKITAQGMYCEENIYLENDKAIGFMKHYKSQKYAFVGVLPKKEGDFSFKDLNLKTLMENKSSEKVRTMIPKFKFDTSRYLTKELPMIGLGKTLEDNSFDSLINEVPLKIGLVLQKTAIDVDEKGTKAAAVTVITMYDNAAPATTVSKEVYLNRPFAFMIYDVENDAPIFVGKVINPII